MIKNKRKVLLSIGGILLVIVGISTLLYFVSPREIVEYIGIKNTYWIIFIVASLGGVSSFTSASYYATLTTLAAGGANPFLLGLMGGIGVSIGDSLFYYLGYRGKNIIKGSPKKYAKKIEEWLNKAPTWGIILAVFIYVAFMPLPNDILMVALAVSVVNYKKIIGAVITGNILNSLIYAHIFS